MFGPLAEINLTPFRAAGFNRDINWDDVVRLNCAITGEAGMAQSCGKQRSARVVEMSLWFPLGTLY